MMAGALISTSCASKKELLECQSQNKTLNEDFQNVKQELAASTARENSLRDQLSQAQKDYARLQRTLDLSLSNTSQNNISIDKLVDQINESNQYIRHLVEVKRLAHHGREARGGCAGAQGRGIYLAGRQYVVQDRQLRD